MAVPLLPHNLMGDMYAELLQQTFNFRDPSKFHKFESQRLPFLEDPSFSDEKKHQGTVDD